MSELQDFNQRVGGVSNVDMDGNNTLQIKAIKVVISTFETRPVSGPSRDTRGVAAVARRPGHGAQGLRESHPSPGRADIVSGRRLACSPGRVVVQRQRVMGRRDVLDKPMD
jgi:hypothetical protein